MKHTYTTPECEAAMKMVERYRDALATMRYDGVPDLDVVINACNVLLEDATAFGAEDFNQTLDAADEIKTRHNIARGRLDYAKIAYRHDERGVFLEGPFQNMPLLAFYLYQKQLAGEENDFVVSDSTRYDMFKLTPFEKVLLNESDDMFLLWQQNKTWYCVETDNEEFDDLKKEIADSMTTEYDNPEVP